MTSAAFVGVSAPTTASGSRPRRDAAPAADAALPLDAAHPKRSLSASFGQRATRRASAESAASASVARAPASGASGVRKRGAKFPPPRLDAEQTAEQLQQRAKARAARFALRDALRPLSTNANRRACGRALVAPSAQLVLADGRASWRGVATCGSVWSCPCCQAPIQALRAQEVGKLARWAEERGYVVVMMTVTVRHAWTHRLADTLTGVARAWRAVMQGAPWKRWKAAQGLVGMVRAVEVTHGANGWHPHAHILAVFRAPREPVPDLRGAVGATMPHAVCDPMGPEAEWLAERWQSKVHDTLGETCAPDLAHGFDVRPLDRATYLCKLGLEIGSGGTKRTLDVLGNVRGRDPWAIAADAAKGDAASAELWREYQTATHRHRQLTWSVGLRQLADIADVSDEVAAQRADEGEAVLVLDLPRRAWRAVLRLGLVLALVEAAERPNGREAARDLVTLGVLDLCAAHPRDG